MSNDRREFLKLGATATAAAAAAGLLSATAGAAEPSRDLPGAPPLPGAAPLRLVTFSTKGTAARVGALTRSDRVVDLEAFAKKEKARLAFDPASMLSLIAAGEPALAQVRAILEKAGETGHRLVEVQLLAPIPVPARNVYAVGWNYLEHFEEGRANRGDPGQTPPDHPVFFTKGTHTVNGPYDPIPYDPKVSTLIDWEGELAVIVGRKGKNIPEAKAMEYVFGFCAINDTTARDVQQKRHGGQWFKGKSLDGYGPMGPWIVTAGGFAHDDLRLVTRVNGVVKQDASTKQMYFKVPRILAELSLGMTLEPGDVIATGTPPGVGHARKPPEYLKPGDVMETEIAGIGTLRNVITAV